MTLRLSATAARCIAASASAIAIAIAIAPSASAAMSAETVLAPLPVSPANASVFATPLAVHGTALYTVNVEPGDAPVPLHDFGLHTVVRRAVRDGTGRWQWQTHLLDSHTANDPYHTAASIGVDNQGYVHVVYNMHDLPWQYSVSLQANSIDGFSFRGQRVDAASQWGSEHRRVNFPALGSADIPGTQITYPAFFSDRNGALYVTYRYALRPAQSWYQRIFAGGIARYDVKTRRWQPIGGAVRLGPQDAQLPAGQTSAISHPFAMQQGWWVYQIRLAFDADNGMHVAWLWRKGNSGPDQQHPSYAFSPAGSPRFFRADGTPLALPVHLNDGEFVAADTLPPLAPEGFYNPARIVTSEDGHPVVTVQAIGGRRYMSRLDANRRWQPAEPVPLDAWQLRFDAQGNEWAFATGLTVLKRRVNADGVGESAWTTVFRGTPGSASSLCNPRVVQGSDTHDGPVFFVHGNVFVDGTCRNDRIAIVRLYVDGPESSLP